jgi:hypothetical protein
MPGKKKEKKKCLEMEENGEEKVDIRMRYLV